MRIIDGSTHKPLTSVTLFLTPNEASELVDTLKGLDPKAGDHAHVADADYKREITVAIYTSDNLDRFSEEARKIISQDRGES